jgi:sterol desaturase/sphingolipid hydroxylase (fatty acid hydroxylase superfamily)
MVNLLIVFLALFIISLIVIELTLAKKKNVKIYNFSDSFTNFFCGMLERVFDVFFSVLALYCFHHIYENYAIFNLSSSISTWILGLFVTDFIAYWFHRWSHQVNFLWAAHIVHHQSEELNITTVFRVSFFAVVFRACFFVWMAFAGFDVFTIVTTSLFLGIYQLFTHSRVIGNLGIIEYFMTTPSHHRVHHARNEKYMDKNYAHIFIFWDRIFGTFMQEEEEPNYGITSGFDSANAYNATFSYWKNLFIRAKKTERFIDKIKVFIKGPKWTPGDVEHLDAVFKSDDKGNRIHQDFKLPLKNKWYTFFSSIITTICFVSLMIYKSSLGENITIIEILTNLHIILLLVMILISIFVHSRTMENKKNAFIFELIRLLLIPFLVLLGFQEISYFFWFAPLTFIYCGALFIWAFSVFQKSNNGYIFDRIFNLQIK